MTIRTGYARIPSTNYKTEQYCIAYLDVLGGANKICQDKNNKFLNYLNMFMKDAIEEAQWASSQYKDKIFTKIFSDNILYAIKIDENDPEREEKIGTIFSLAAGISNEIFRFGHLVRGSIVIGDFFYNENIVYGKGLVNSVKLEEKEAIYPRIIIQAEIAKEFSHLCIPDPQDNKTFLNTFLFSDNFDHVSFKLGLLKILRQNELDETIDESHKNNIREKIKWTINYFNYWFALPISGVIERPQITDAEIQESLR